MNTKLYIPLMNSAVHEETRATYLEQLSVLESPFVFLAVDRSVFFCRGEERKKQCELLRRNIAFFKSNGYEVGVWIQVFGFGDILKGSFADIAKEYTRLRSVKGREVANSDMLCPTNELFLDDYMEFVRDMVATGCETLMLDDDFCLSVRPGLGCFCGEHVALLEQELQESLQGADLPALFFTGGESRYRNAYLKVMGDTLRRFALRVRRTVDALNPSVRVGFCAGYTSWDIEGVDALELTRILAGNTKPFLRFTGAPYWAAASVDRFHGQPLAAIIEDARSQERFCRFSEVEIFCEADSFPRPRYMVPSSLLECFSLAMRASGGMGELCYLFDYHASPSYETGYLKHRIYNRPLYDFIERHFSDKLEHGVRVYHEMKKLAQAELPAEVNEKEIMKMHFNRGAELLGVHGIPTVYGQDAACGIAFGEEARYIDLLPSRLVLDVKGAQILQQRGIDVGMLNVTSAPVPTFEYTEGEKHVAAASACDGYRRVTLKQEACVMGEFECGEERYPSVYRYSNGTTEFLVYTFDVEAMPHHSAILRSYARACQLYRFFGNISYMEHAPGLYQLCKKGEGETAILLVNISQDPIFDGKLFLDADYRTAELCGVAGHLCGRTLCFDSPLPPYGACAILLQ